MNWIALVVTVVLLVVLYLIAQSAGRRFERDEIRKGRWDTSGPLVETRGPVGGRGAMGERLEVVGEWDAPVVNDRRRLVDPAHKPKNEE